MRTKGGPANGCQPHDAFVIDDDHMIPLERQHGSCSGSHVEHQFRRATKRYRRTGECVLEQVTAPDPHIF